MASSGSWSLALRFACRLCVILALVLDTKISVVADDDSNVPGVNSAGVGGGVSELCDNELSSFMLPPYGNLSDIVCRPIWNTFVLRVSLCSQFVLQCLVGSELVVATCNVV